MPELLTYHQRRMDNSRKALHPKANALKLVKLLENIDLPASGTFKLRLEYGVGLKRHELVPYSIRPVETIRLVDANDLRYGKKFADRTCINKQLANKATSDDVLFIQRGHLTDTSYANVALFDGSHWYTPAWPLLRGTRREFLIENGTLRPSMIRERDLANFEKLRMINAMMPWGTGPELDMEHVKR